MGFDLRGEGSTPKAGARGQERPAHAPETSRPGARGFHFLSYAKPIEETSQPAESPITKSQVTDRWSSGQVI